MANESINYARYEGIQHSELPAAIVFTLLYVPSFVLFLVLGFKRPTFVWRSLALFSVVRATAFALRAVLAGSSTAGTNLNLYIAQQVIYSVGFFGLLYSAYTLVLDRDDMVNGPDKKRQLPGPLGIIAKIAKTRMLVRVILMAAVGLGVAAGIKQSDNDSSSQSTGNSLRKVSTIIFLVVSIMLLLVTVTLVYDEHRGGMLYEVTPSIGKRYGTIVLLTVAMLCIVREAFLCATLGNTARQNEAALFYPLAASTEFVAALLFLVPGLVPSKYEIEARRDQVQNAHSEGYALNSNMPQAYASGRPYATPA